MRERETEREKERERERERDKEREREKKTRKIILLTRQNHVIGFALVPLSVKHLFDELTALDCAAITCSSRTERGKNRDVTFP